MGGLLINSATAQNRGGYPTPNLPNLNGPLEKIKWKKKGKGDQKGQKNRKGEGKNSQDTV